MSKPQPGAPLYRPLDFAMLRAPLLPVEAYRGLASDGESLALLGDPRVRRAVAAGSISLLQALDRFEQSALTGKDAERLKAKLLRYEIRMSTRPTPYGLFAGCATVRFGARTDLRLLSSFGHSRTRPDMAWLMDLVVAAEGDPAVRRNLRFIRNPLIRSEGDRISLEEGVPGGSARRREPVSARATGVVNRALDLSRSGIGYRDLAEQLLRSNPSATPEKVDRLLSELWQQTFLLTDLRPPLTSDDPARYVLDRLRAIPEGAGFADKLARFLEAASVWDQSAHEENLPALRNLLHASEVAEDASANPPFQVDMALHADGTLGLAIAKEAAAAAELLLRLTPSPGGLPSIAAYRSAFVSRYGHEREVPLLELLDPDRGLGPLAGYGHAFTGPGQAKAAKRSQTLLGLACDALHQRSRVVQLDDALLSALETWRPEPATAPLSLDINLLIAAPSAEAIDGGNFTVVVGPNLGGWAAGRNFGRFAYLEPRDHGIELLRTAASAEESARYSDHLWAEVVYLPANVRSANVAVRPPVRAFEVTFGVSPGVPESAVIPLDELVVGVEGGHFYVRWPAAGKRVRFVSGHMLNHHGAPSVAQFLLQTTYDSVPQFTSFDWGPAETFPYLPRVQASRIVLRPAEWKLVKPPAGDPLSAFHSFRTEWELPRYICLSFGDNRLILDLEQESHVSQIAAEMGKLQDGQTLLLQEVVPALDEAWLAGAEGHYYSELIVPLVLQAGDAARRETSDAAESLAAPQVDEAAPVHAGAHAMDADRRRLPGGDWLFAKLYGPADRQDDLIGDSLMPFAENVIAAGLAIEWFFIRFADPEPHLRLRFRGDPDRLSGHLFAQICHWADGLVAAELCTRLAFDTYDREIERFGGSGGMTLAESFFYADSRAAAQIVKILRSGDWADGDIRLAFSTLAVDDLLGSLGMDETERLAWYRTQSPAGSDSGAEYRKLKNVLRSALGDSRHWLAERTCGDVLLAALDRRRCEVSAIAGQLRSLHDRARLGQSLSALGSSYVHLHLNRIGGSPTERLVLALLARTRDSLAKASVKAVSD